MSSRPWRDVAAAIAALPRVEELGATVAGRWTANLATPAIICAPTRRYLVRSCDVRYDLALQVVAGVQADDDELLHELVELALGALPAGIIYGETTYGTDELAGATVVVATSTLTA